MTKTKTNFPPHKNRPSESKLCERLRGRLFWVLQDELCIRVSQDAATFSLLSLLVQSLAYREEPRIRRLGPSFHFQTRLFGLWNERSQGRTLMGTFNGSI